MMNVKIDTDSLGFLISDSLRVMRVAFDRRIADAGLGITPGEARVLLNVAAADGSRQLEIAARMGVEPMTVCTFLDKLQAQDLIERQPDPTDRRAKKIMLTEKADGMVDIIRTEMRVVVNQATRGMSTETKNVLHDALIQFRDNLQNPDNA